MAESDQKVPRRTFFISSDIELLLECAKAHKDVIENKKTNKCTPEMKRKVRFRRFLSMFFEIYGLRLTGMGENPFGLQRRADWRNQKLEESSG